MANSVFLSFSSGPFAGQTIGPAADNTAAPPFTFLNDLTTGLGSSAAGSVNLVALGTKVVTASGANSGQLLVGATNTSSSYSAGAQMYVGRTATTTLTYGIKVALDVSGATQVGIESNGVYSGATAASVGSLVRAFDGRARTITASTDNLTATTISGGIGNYLLSTHNGSGIVSLATGLTAQVNSSGTNSPITDSAAFMAQTPTISAGTTNATHSGNWVRGGAVSGTLTTRYGVRIDDLVGGATRFAISQEGATDLNAFAGDIVLGAAGATKVAISHTAPTIASGFGTSPSIVASNGTFAFTINVGTGGSASAGVITMPAAANGWTCQVVNITNAAANITDMTAMSTTSITLGSFSRTLGTSVAWAASDVIQIAAQAF